LLSDLSGERIIILSTHIVSDVEAAATRIALINRGSLAVHAAPEELLQKIEGKVWEWVVPKAELNSVKQHYLTSGTVRRSDGVHVRVLVDTPLPGAEHVAPALEDAYLYSLNNRRAGDAA
jgi:ABC-2 type transport system ATP-binding protein